MRITLVAQNRQDLDNLGPIAAELRRLDTAPGIVSLAEYYEGGLGTDIAGYGVEEVTLGTAPVTLIGNKALPAARAVVRTRDRINELVEESNAVVISSPGPLERTFVSAAGDRGLPTFIVQQGILAEPEPPGTITRAKRGIIQAGSRLLALFGVRGLTGRGRGVPFDGIDRVYAMGEASLRALRAQGAAPQAISVTGSPRFAGLFTDPLPAPDPDAPILFLTSSFTWAGHPDESSRQAAMIDELAETRRPVVLRVHPREPSGSYQTAGLDLSLPDEPLRDAFARTGPVLAIASTAVFEAVAAGRIGFVIPGSFGRGWEDYPSLLAASLRDALGAVDRATEALADQQRQDALRAIDPASATAAETIAADIVRTAKASPKSRPG